MTHISISFKIPPANNKVLSAPTTSGVSQITLEITAPDMATITKTLSVSPGDTVIIDLDVPSGSGRKFQVRAFDAQSILLFYGETTQDLVAGVPITVQIDMVAVIKTLSIALAGNGSGTVASSPTGINCGADCSKPYNIGTVVTLIATPDTNSTFAGWSGGGCTGTGTCTITISADTTVTATFNLKTFTLTAAKTGTGSGTVTSSLLLGIDCGPDCSEAYTSGTVVTLTAIPAAGSTFVGWSGGGCIVTGTCTVTLIADTTVTATFTLSTSIGGNIIAIAGGDSHSLALKSDGTLWAWGFNSSGQLGDGTLTDKTLPVRVGGATPITGVVAIAGGDFHTIALKSDGTVWGWGWNSSGQLGDGTLTDKTLPVRVGGATPITGVVAIAGGGIHSLALKSDGTLWAWGFNSSGQLGDGTTTNRSLPVQVGGATPITGVIAIAGGDRHTIALKSDGTLWAWGFNFVGQLGDGTLTDKTLPVQVGGATPITGVVAIAGGDFHTIALKSDGTLWAWGWNFGGQLGDGTTTNRSLPVQVGGATPITGVVAIAGGGIHSLALKSDGTLWAWGFNFYGQLGDGTLTDKTLPVQVGGATPITGVVAIAGGFDHSLALKSDGTVWGWGWNFYGQLGDGTTTNRSLPVQVVTV